MLLNEYQILALKTEKLDIGTRFSTIARVLGIVTEAGELADVLKREMEGKDNRSCLHDELGDVLWYVAVLAEHIGLSLETLAKLNIAKLANRYPDLHPPQ